MKHQLNLPLELEPFREKILGTVRPFIKILPQISKETLPWESKIGGTPYLPEGIEYPTNGGGRPLFFLAQFNFAETPRLDPFPEKGILQFFINTDGLWGLNLENPLDTSGFLVQYFEDVTSDKSKVVANLSLPPFEDMPLLNGHGQTFPLKFELSEEAVPLSDCRFVELLGENFFHRFGDRQWEIMEAYSKKINAGGHKLGGYAFFTQQDPRYDRAPMELLFQLDSDPAIGCFWGDMGVGNFFIRKEDLIRKDFSRILYNWDCY
jgi:uncharacterized protein YwqG